MLTNKSLFLRQSYLDAWDDYQRSLVSPRFIQWDYIILTASNENQAEAYRTQIAIRIQKNLLPPTTHFAVLPDPEGKRVGSGGATLNVLRYIAEREGNANPFEGKRILVIHSGGDSKRVPQYSALGKLFSPVPRELPNGKRSTLFDEFIIGMSSVPQRIREGMLVLSGDVLLLFNPLQIDFTGSGAAAISFKEHVEVGKNHGVFRIGDHGNVDYCLQKMTEQTLREMGAVNERNMVDIDTGAVLLAVPLLYSLYQLISTDETVDQEKFNKFVNERARISFYGDFLFPLAEKATLEQYYREKPEGSFCTELMECRTAIWDVLRPYRMKLLRLSPAAFIHFGTTGELLDLMNDEIGDYAFLDWKRWTSSNAWNVPYAVNNTVISEHAAIGPGCYLEDCYIDGAAVIGKGSIVSNVLMKNQNVPESVVLHGLKLKNGNYVVRVYGVKDNPKGSLESDTEFLGVSLKEFISINGISISELWQEEDHYLWNAKLYPAAGTMEAALEAALNICAMARGKGDVQAWRKSIRNSLCSGFNEADSQAIIDWGIWLRKAVKCVKLLHAIEAGETWQKASLIFDGVTLNDYQKKWLEDKAEKLDYPMKIRIYFYLGKIIGGAEGEKYIDKCFASIGQGILQGALDALTVDNSFRICQEEVLVQLPLRVNWGGGWSDTPPYCNECGGTVLNAAISLNGQLPVEVCLKRLSKSHIILESADLGASAAFTDLGLLQDTHNPYDPFALHKSALIACGVLPYEGGSLEEVLERLGGGLYLSTQVRGVPKGSGLGTSSILAAACVKGIYELFGRQVSEDELYDRVLCMEQIMSTGGGWQDQVGGMTKGVKYIMSQPGMKQELKVRHIELPPSALFELNNRFALIYTGQRRLARNLLRDVIGRYIGANPDAVNTLKEIQRSAALMCFELERGNIDAFASLLSGHWELSKKLDEGSTNTCIDQIFNSIDDLISGRMICGAGGGGFLQVILKTGVTKQELSKRLHEVFEDSGIDVWDCELI
jgi:fucokinase